MVGSFKTIINQRFLRLLGQKEYCRINPYADNTTSSCTSKRLFKIKEKV